MQIDIKLLISIASAAFAIYMGIKNFSKSSVETTKKDAFEAAKISVKLDEIGSDVKDIKYDISSVKGEVKEIDKRLTVAEQAISTIQKQVEDRMK